MKKAERGRGASARGRRPFFLRERIDVNRWLAAGCVAFVLLAGGSASAWAATLQAADWALETDCAACHTREAKTLDVGETEEEESSGSAASGATDNGRETEERGEVSEQPGSSPEEEETQAVPDLMTAHGGALECIACHDGPALGGIHEDVDESSRPARRLKQTTVSSDLCATCHDREQLVEQTSSSKVIVDKLGTTVNPHDLPDGEFHDMLSCTSCHNAHTGSTAAESTMKVCLSCHHAEVFECYTCHE